MEIKLFLRIEPEPPRVTHQQQKTAVVKGKVVKYEEPRLRRARALFASLLKPHAPEEPWEGPVYMEVRWFFRGKADGYYIKRPDCDNLQKLLQDCMTECGYWRDDAQVMPFIQKFQRINEPHGVMIKLKEMENDR